MVTVLGVHIISDHMNRNIYRLSLKRNLTQRNLTQVNNHIPPWNILLLFWLCYTLKSTCLVSLCGFVCLAIVTLSHLSIVLTKAIDCYDELWCYFNIEWTLSISKEEIILFQIACLWSNEMQCRSYWLRKFSFESKDFLSLREKVLHIEGEWA